MNISELQEGIKKKATIGLAVSVLSIVAFTVVGWYIPAVICSIGLGRVWGSLAYHRQLQQVRDKLEVIKTSISERVQTQVQQHMNEFVETRKQFDLMAHKSASEACSALAETEVEGSDPGVIFGDTDRGKQMSMKPGLGNAVALSPFMFSLIDDED